MKKFGFVASVFAVIVMLFVVSPSSSQSSPMEELEGTLEIMVATNLKQKECKTLYSIKVGKERIPFDLPAHSPPNLSSGQKVKIAGKQSGKNFRCRKIVPVTSAFAPVIKKATISSDNDVSSYLPKQKPVSGKIKTVVASVYFDDIPAPEWGKDKANDKIYFNDYSLTAYWEECSGGIMWLSGSDNTLEVWLKMPKDSSKYGYSSEDERNYVDDLTNDVIELLDPYVDFSECDHLVIFRAGGNWVYDWSTYGKNLQETDDGKFNFSTNLLVEGDIEINNSNAAHEFGHALEDVHAHSKSVSNGKVHPYGDWWDTRGKDGLSDILHKWIHGWLGTDQIKIITASGDFWLNQREIESDGIKLLIIHFGFDEYGSPVFIYIEYHRGLGKFDSKLHFENTNEAVDPNNLVLIRRFENVGGYDSVVYMADDDGNDCLDLESQEFQDSEYGVRVQVLNKTGTGTANDQVEVKITLPQDYTVPTPISTPTPEPSPTPSPSPTPTPVCEAELIEVYPNLMTLKVKKVAKLNVTVKGADGCPVEGQLVKATVNAAGKKRLSVQRSNTTNENGEAAFTIVTKNKVGMARIRFLTGDISSESSVKVVR